MFNFFNKNNFSRIKKIIDDQKKSDNDKIIEIDETLSSLFETGASRLSENERNFVYIENLEREINNGGFGQFFLNSSGNYANETLNALKFIKADKTAALLSKAMAEFPESNVPRDSDERQKIIDKIEDKANNTWNDLDEKFYAYEDNLAGLLLKLTRDNIQDFSH